MTAKLKFDGTREQAFALHYSSEWESITGANSDEAVEIELNDGSSVVVNGPALCVYCGQIFSPDEQGACGWCGAS